MKFDDFFETVQETKALPQSHWQRLARFETDSPIQIPTFTPPQTGNSTPVTIPRNLRESAGGNQGDIDANDETHVQFTEETIYPEANRFQSKKKRQPRRFLLHFLILSNIAIQRPHVAPQDNLLLLVG
jgi:hypothetical protein